MSMQQQRCVSLLNEETEKSLLTSGCNIIGEQVAETLNNVAARMQIFFVLLMTAQV